MRTCPVCKRTYDEHPALSRKDNRTEICPDCGMMEVLEALALNMKQEPVVQPDIVTAYSPEADITFIMEDCPKYTKVVGFHFREPDDEATEKFCGKLIAEFDM